MSGLWSHACQHLAIIRTHMHTCRWTHFQHGVTSNLKGEKHDSVDLGLNTASLRSSNRILTERMLTHKPTEKHADCVIIAHFLKRLFLSDGWAKWHHWWCNHQWCDWRSQSRKWAGLAAGTCSSNEANRNTKIRCNKQIFSCSHRCWFCVVCLLRLC